MKNLEHILDEARNQFPRLYFLSNQEMVELLGISRNPRLLVPFVRKCFSGIEDLTFELPTDGTGMNTTLDLALKSELGNPTVHLLVLSLSLVPDKRGRILAGLRNSSHRLRASGDAMLRRAARETFPCVAKLGNEEFPHVYNSTIRGCIRFHVRGTKVVNLICALSAKLQKSHRGRSLS